MVVGLDKFKEFFREFNDKFVVIGGAACDVILEDSEIEPRATDDIDMILIVDKMTPEFGKRFWEFIAEGNYQTRERKRGEGKEPVPELFRFIKPRVRAILSALSYCQRIRTFWESLRAFISRPFLPAMTSQVCPPLLWIRTAMSSPSQTTSWRTACV